MTSIPGLLAPSRPLRQGADEYISVRISNGTVYAPLIIKGEGAFGDVITAELNPEVQGDFVYAGHADLLFEGTEGTGTIVYDTASGRVKSGASIGGRAFLRTRRVVRYRPGQGVLFRFTAAFTAPVVGVSQLAGAFGGGENGLFFGYDHTDAQKRYGVMRLFGGVRTVHTLQMDTAATGAESYTITLNGDDTVVSLTSGTLADNAQEIADTSFAGWAVEADGSHVHFLADKAEVRGGSYTESSTGTAAGTFTEELAGVVPTPNWKYQGNFSHDNLDGSGPSGMTIVPTFGNPYQIRMQFLGHGALDFGIEDPTTGKFMLVHRFEHANSQLNPSSTNPTYHVGILAENVSVGSNVTVSTSSLSGFIEGPKFISGPDRGFDIEGSASAAIPVLSVRNNLIFVNGISRVNLRDLLPTLVSVAGSGSNKPIKVKVVLNGTLTDPLWSDHPSPDTLSAIDVSATGITGGDTLFATGFSSGGDAKENLASLDMVIRPEDVISIVVEPTGTAVDFVASLSWKEDV